MAHGKILVSQDKGEVMKQRVMTKLGDRNFALLTQGAKTTGDYVEAFYYCEEQIYCNEYDTILGYCTWLKETGKGQGWGNYEQRFAEYLETKKG